MASIQPPKLDDRTWEDLRRELVQRIPVHAPAWTDHSPSDPGIALIELFAWLGENLLQRMDQVPENSRLEFLRLLGLNLRGATPARALVQLALDPGPAPAAGLLLEQRPDGERVLASAGRAQFELADEIDVLPVEGLAAVKLKVSSPNLDPDQIQAIRDTLEDHLGERPEPVYYETRRLPEPKGGRPGAPIPLVLAVDHCLWIALCAPAAWLKLHSTEALTQALRGRVLSIAVQVDEALAGATDAMLVEDPSQTPPPPEVRWQVSTGAFLEGLSGRVDGIRYDRLRVVSDGTLGLQRSGVVRLDISRDGDLGAWNLEDDAGRALAGVGDLPPALDDPELEARVLCWVRAYRPAAPHPRVRWAAPNAVELEQAVGQRAELLGNGNGQPGQAFRLSRPPILPESAQIEVREALGWVRWTAVSTLAHARGDDPFFEIDGVSGEVRFGDGLHGRMPRPGELVRARAYRSSLGAAGNVPPLSISRLSGALPPGGERLKVRNLLPASGGRDGETVVEASERLPRVLRHNDRAVGSEDFRDIALATPGAAIGRAHVLPRHKPDERLDGVAGAVTLIVLPAWDPEHPDEPVPDRELLRKVAEHMEPRRLVTTELYLAAPEYVPVWVSLAIEPEDGFGIGTIRRWVELGVRQHLAPLPPYGPAATGWPFGRAVRTEDVMAAALAVQGVRLVRHARLTAEAIDADGKRRPIELNSHQVDADAPHGVPLLPWQLPTVRGVLVSAAATADAPGQSDAAPDVPLSVAIPVIPERC